MDYQTLFNIAFTVAGGFGGFFLHSVWDAVRDLQKSDKDIINRVSHVEVLVAGDYVKRDELAREFGKLDGKLDAIFKKLDGKADK